MAHHSSVNYVEPNLTAVGGEYSGGTFGSWKVSDDFERSPRLEDYSITVNLEVEVCSRNNISQSNTITSDVLLLSYKTNVSNGTSVVNFMGGTKIKSGNDRYKPIQYLTTNYADMYVGDLIDYGTTEMIGIKSIDVEYLKSCVPQITIKFTDVRGLSLFQPTELSRTNSYQGITGINSDNVAQSFFQCFFRVPMPKFTITIKGFYGKPVTYEVMCDKFDTDFNSKTGDFDITARFIGYSYSFLTDISIDALLAAPYSDYHGGKDYWEEQKKSRFVIPNKEKTKEMPMPTLFEIWQEMKSILKKDVNTETSLSDEEKSHTEEITELQTLQRKYRIWYETLFNVLTEIYGKDYCYLFKEDGMDGEYYRILVLANSETVRNSSTSLSKEYEAFPDSFKLLNKDLYASVETYNAKGTAFKKLANVSEDFSDYTVSNLFNNLFVNGDNNVVFNGFYRTCKLPKTQVVKHIFYGVKYSGNTNEEIAAKENQHKKYVLNTIYGNGTDQYVKCYTIDVDYRSIRDRINALQANANMNLTEKEHQKRIKEINKKMFAKMSWYPSVENFTKIMVAHLETLMQMMFNMVNKCEGRTAKQLGVFDNCKDVNIKTENNVIPPFPRVTKKVFAEDGSIKTEDSWVGEYDKGEIPFEEVDFINGLFNAVERLEALKKDMEAIETENGKTSSTQVDSLLVKHPLSSLDFFTTKNPYGESSEISNDIKGYEFAGKVAIRMFNILCLNNFRREFNSKIIGEGFLKNIARTEADNFYDIVKITNSKIITMIRDKIISADNILRMVTSANDDKDCPWGKKVLFDNSKDNMWLNAYKVSKNGYENTLYPFQGYSFSKLDEYLNALNSDKISNYNNEISIQNIPSSVSDNSMITNDDCVFGDVSFLDDFESVQKMIDNSNSSSDSGYTEYYNIIQSACTFDEEEYESFVKLGNTSPSICKKINKNSSLFEIKGNNVIVDGEAYDNSSMEGFASQARQNTLSDYTITEIFPPKNISGSEKKNLLAIDSNSSLKVFRNRYKLINQDCGGIKLSDSDCLTTALINGIKLNTNALGTYLMKNKTVSYVPKLAILQIGSIIYESGGIHSERFGNTREIAKKYIPVGSDGDYSSELFKHINSLSKPARLGYMKYYINWCKSHSHYASKLLSGKAKESDKYYIFPKSKECNRRLLKENDELVKEMTNELLSPVAIVKLSMNYRTSDYNNMINHVLDKTKAKSYLDAFIGRLEELYKINYAEDSSGNLIKTTDEPKKTTIDMKAELYRYMKQVYDKWIPMSPLSDWRLESFFNDKNGEESGHKFYFIDSYYNNIAHKLIVNPKIISEKIDALLNYRDVNAMMLGFMADIYGANKCMLMSIQNFADLKKPNSMNEMFTTLPYNSIDWASINKHPSFVVVYPYEPSRNLDIPNNEYNNDGFMLNDEFETPEAIRTKTDAEGQYRIPAFGVSYGKQYQSYFKSVNIDMKSPIATQQSIQAKHFIIREQASTKEKGIVGQDLYDVYSTQSYNCSVEMMGCAWVQPLMYFVLLNVPMFRGSYLIMKVKHSIRPGDMSTTFTGCRMANVSNKLVEDIFTDEDFLGDESSVSAYEIEKELKADISNDCPYKIYPLFENNNLDFAGDEKDKANYIMRKLEPHFGKAGAAGIVGNMKSESEFNPFAVNKSGSLAAGLVQWKDNYYCLQDMLTNDYTEYGYNPSKYKSKYKGSNADEVITKMKSESKGLDYQIQFVIDSIANNSHSEFKNIEGLLKSETDPKKCADIFREKYEKNKDLISQRQDNAKKYFDAYDSSSKPTSSQPTNANPNKKKEVATAFFEAVNKSAQYTPSIGIKLKNLGIDQNGYLKINQEGGKTDKLAVVFDMILNSEYYNYIQELGWVYPNGGLETDSPPDVIYCKVSEKPYPNSKIVWANEFGNKIVNNLSNEIPTSDDSSNKLLLKSLGKKYASLGEKNFKKEVPQIRNVKNLDKYTPQNCNSLFNSGGGTSSGNISGFSGQVTNNKMKQVLQDVSHYYLNHKYSTPSSKRAVKGSGANDAPFDTGKCTYAPSTWYNNAGLDLYFYPGPDKATHSNTTLGNYGFKMVWHGTVKQALSLPVSSFRPGDISTQYYYLKGAKSAHGCMWTGKDWRSDFVQQTIMANTSAEGRDEDYSVCIWRHPDFQEPNLPLA